jgi:hypothetical protein
MKLPASVTNSHMVKCSFIAISGSSVHPAQETIPHSYCPECSVVTVSQVPHVGGVTIK